MSLQTCLAMPMQSRCPLNKKRVGLLIMPSGETSEVLPADKKDFSLAELQQFVGGNIEKISLLPGNGHNIMYVNEDGKRLCLHPNQRASALARICAYNGETILGTAIVLSRRAS